MLDKKDFKNVVCWYTKILKKEDSLTDTIIINLRDNIIKYYKFKRIKIVYFCEIRKEYRSKYLINADYLILIQKLNNYEKIKSKYKKVA